MANKIEQIVERGTHVNQRACYGHSFKKYKQMCNRALRRRARRDPENAPTKIVFQGWVS